LVQIFTVVQDAMEFTRFYGRQSLAGLDLRTSDLFKGISVTSTW